MLRLLPITAAIAIAAACSGTDKSSDDDDGGSNPGAGKGSGAKAGAGGTGGASAGGRGGKGGALGIGGEGGILGTAGGDAGGPEAGGGDGSQAGGTGGAGGSTGDTGGEGNSAGEPDVGGAGSGAGGGSSGSSGGSAGGAAVTCGDTYSVTDGGFVLMPGYAGACFHGYAYAGGDSGSVITPTSFATCGSGCQLLVNGTVNKADKSNSYAGAVYLGFNVNQAFGSSTQGTVAPTGTGIAITYTVSGTTPGLRLQVEQGTNAWCRDLTIANSTVQIPYSTLKTNCWDSTGVAYGKQPIDSIQLIIPGGASAQSFALGITSVSEY
jgi:hypothetical protein